MRTTRPIRLAAALAATTLLLTACASDDGDGGASGSSSDSGSGSASTPSDTTTAPADEGTDATAFPVTVEHAFGSTTVEAAPQRVVTWGWGSTEAAIALGVHPVAMTEQVWTSGAGGQLPWIEEAVPADALPTLLTDDFTAPPYEEIIAADPDLILAQYSGIDQEQYELLSEIAPTIAFPEGPWSTPWRDVITIAAQALGRPDAGAEILSDLEGFFADQEAAHPEFAGVTVANIWDGDGSVSVYTSADPRVSMLEDLGFVVADSVDGLDTDPAEDNFYYELSYEQVDGLDADLLITYHATQEEADAFLTKPEVQAIPAVAAGQVAQVVGTEVISSVSPPTALSVEWGMPGLIETMSRVLAG